MNIVTDQNTRGGVIATLLRSFLLPLILLLPLRAAG